jgi:hypothetical protein
MVDRGTGRDKMNEVGVFPACYLAVLRRNTNYFSAAQLGHVSAVWLFP